MRTFESVYPHPRCRCPGYGRRSEGCLMCQMRPTIGTKETYYMRTRIRAAVVRVMEGGAKGVVLCVQFREGVFERPDFLLRLYTR
jgi:hypothetical protein